MKDGGWELRAVTGYRGLGVDNKWHVLPFSPKIWSLGYIGYEVLCLRISITDSNVQTKARKPLKSSLSLRLIFE